MQLSYLSTLENSVWDEPEHYVQIIQLPWLICSALLFFL